MLQHLDVSVCGAGRDKHPNRLLVDLGGAEAAWLLGAELRRVSDSRIGLPQLMAAMYCESQAFDMAVDDAVAHDAI